MSATASVDYHKGAKRLRYETRAFIDGRFVDALSGTVETLRWHAEAIDKIQLR